MPDMPPAQMWLSAMMQFWMLRGPRLTWHTRSWHVLSDTMGAFTCTTQLSSARLLLTLTFISVLEMLPSFRVRPQPASPVLYQLG